MGSLPEADTLPDRASAVALATAEHIQRARLRRALRSVRQSLTTQAQRRAARALCRRIINAPWLRGAHKIALYVADDGEINPAPLLQLLRARGKRCYLPTLRGAALSLAAPRLRFIRYNGSALVPGRFGIAAPRGRAYMARQMDVIMLPLVAFDRSGTRLGRGGGFYDRALQHRPGQHRPLLVGLAHGIQEVVQKVEVEVTLPNIPAAAWDVRLDTIVTPDEVIRVRSTQQ